MSNKVKKQRVKYEINDIRDILNKPCKISPNRIAFLEKEDHKQPYKEITYGTLRMDTVALGTALLKELNLKGEKVAVLGENSYRWCVSYLSIICGLGVVVPLDKELPVNEIENLLNRSGATAIIYTNRRKEKVEELKGKVKSVKYFINMNIEEDDGDILSFDRLKERGAKLIAEGNKEYEELPIDRDTMSALLFTSGTTSEPKGVMLSHRNICANINNALRLINIKEDDRFFSILPIHHAYECSNGFLIPLAVGASVAFGEGLKSIVPNIQETNPTVMLVVPLLLETVYKRIIDNARKQGKEKMIHTMAKITDALGPVGKALKPKVFKQIHDVLGGKLRMVIVGAAPLDEVVAAGMQSVGFTVYQGYGLTETSPLVSVSPESCIKYKSVGFPIDNVEVKIDNPNDEGMGEILVKGDNVMLGYFMDEEKTNEVIKDGWFYTGDIGYKDEDGYIYITGRVKSVIVTSNGKNIFPEELESILNKYDLIKESMVYGFQDKNDKSETSVAAKVVLDKEYLEQKYGNKIPDNDELEKQVKEIIKEVNKTLVSYKAIKHFEIRDKEFEKTTTMKIKRYKN